ncbi:MAG TPA: SDR family oxidoreductase [Solirubrobacteraceae bacterium]|nr:SDR family oxidoreductase [Solirubrobacteraceae bacterium]
MKIIITGATRGIGNAVARRLAPRATEMLIVAQDEERLQHCQQELVSAGVRRVETAAVDISKPGAAQLVRRVAESREFHPDVLILNAGIFIEASLVDGPEESFRRTLEANLTFDYAMAREFAGVLQLGDCPRIFLVGSTAGFEAYEYGPAYGIAKWGIRGLVVNLRHELRKVGIGVTHVVPGSTLTDLWAGEDLPENRLLEPDDIAKVIDACLSLSEQAVVEEVIVRPILGDMHE